MKLLKNLSALALTATLGLSAYAQTAPFQASLWAPEPQLISSIRDVSGVRLQVYGENHNVTGVDIGFAHSTTGDFIGFGGLFALYNHVGGTTQGVQWGLFNYTEGEFTGWQSGWININAAKLKGFQSGLVNYNDIDTADCSGLQLGIINTAKNVHGVQLGLINYAQTLNGVQIGLWNQVNARGWGQFDPLPKVFPFINIGF